MWWRLARRCCWHPLSGLFSNNTLTSRAVQQHARWATLFAYLTEFGGLISPPHQCYMYIAEVEAEPKGGSSEFKNPPSSPSLQLNQSQAQEQVRWHLPDCRCSSMATLLREDQLAEMRQIFDLFDADGDGLLEVEEVGTIWASCGTVLTEAEVRRSSRATFSPILAAAVACIFSLIIGPIFPNRCSTWSRNSSQTCGSCRLMSLSI